MNWPVMHTPSRNITAAIMLLSGNHRMQAGSEEGGDVLRHSSSPSCPEKVLAPRRNQRLLLTSLSEATFRSNLSSSSCAFLPGHLHNRPLVPREPFLLVPTLHGPCGEI
mmetsp:Transcript_27154/g.63131  ORF Transcript_27154/g.63131 Transcript_27154/m.63131 type:complete len:109 (-) Transcript_27154:1191-1517(-)